MPRGGSRVGAGRKPKAKAIVLGMDGARRIASEVNVATPEADAIDLAVPPADLPEAQHAFWRRYAPAALEQRTLAPSTVAGFRELCERFVLKETLAARIASFKLGAASKSADPLLRQYVKLAQRVEASLKEFKLTAFGKPVLAMTPTHRAANPWSEVG